MSEDLLNRVVVEGGKELFAYDRHNKSLDQQKYYEEIRLQQEKDFHEAKLRQDKEIEEKRAEQYEGWQNRSTVWTKKLVIATIVMSAATIALAITNIILMIRK